MSFALVVVPVLYVFHHLGTRVFFNFLAADSMYYLHVANNYVKYGFPTSDGVNATNGFQPLWAFLLFIIFKLFNITHDNQIYAVFALSALCVGVAYSIMSLAFSQLLEPLASFAATLTLFPGLYSTAFEPRTRYEAEPGILYALNPWSAINGVESPLVLLTWSIFFFILARNYRTRMSRANFKNLRLSDYFPHAARWSLAAILLCRLEYGLLLIAIIAGTLEIPAEKGLARIWTIATVLWPSALVACLYVVFNIETVGSPLPVSGTSKLGLSVYANALNIRDTFINSAGQDWWIIASRIYPVIFGALAGVVLVSVGFNSKMKRADFVETVSLKSSIYLYIFGYFLLLDAAFLFFYVDFWHQGYWYYWPFILIPGVFFALQLGAWIKRTRILGMYVVLACLSVLLFRLPNELHLMQSAKVAQIHDWSNYADMTYELWENRRSIREDILKRYPDAKLVEPFDGAFGFVLDLPARSFTGLLSSPLELQRREKIGFWESAVEDGYTIVPNFAYFRLASEGKHFSLVEEFRPASSPVSFYRIKSP